jgi:hypothetical protein
MVMRHEMNVRQGREIRPPARRFGRGLLPAAALILVLVPLAVVLFLLASVQFIGYDSTWNIFITRQDVWQNFWMEVFDNEHPPLFYLLLRLATAWLGSNAVTYRLVSVLSVVASAWLLAYIVRWATANTALGILAAAAFGFSFKAIAMGLEVRGYPLCTALTLAACVFYLDWIGTRPARLAGWKAAGFATTLTAALLTEYSAFFFMAAAIAAPLMLAAFDSRWRHRFLRTWRFRPVATGMMFAVPVATAAVAYRVHVSHWVGRISHVGSFVFDGAFETPVVFLARNTINVVRLLLPAWRRQPIGPASFPHGVHMDSQAWAGFIVIGGICAVGMAGMVPSRAPRPRLVVLLFSVMIWLNAAAGLARWYPFGGVLRHEYFLVPFAFAAFFTLVESARRSLGPRWGAQSLWIAAVALGVFISVLSWTSAFRVLPEPLFQQQMDRFTELIGSPRTVLVDQFNFITVFNHHHDWQWRVIRQEDPKSWQVWLVTQAGTSLRVCRDRGHWQLNMSLPDTYRSAMKCLEDTGTDRVALFRPQWPGASAEWDVSQTYLFARTLSHQTDLRLTLIDVDEEDVYAQFARANGKSPFASIPR